MALSISKAHLAEMVSQALSETPNECCGILAGKGDAVSRVFRASNAEASPVRYRLHPEEMFRIFKEVEREGVEIIGFYHSHTHSEAYPSATDRELAFYPDCRYVIVSTKDPASPVVRAFHIVEGAVTEEPVEVTD
ncbi:MAG: M67 family metallopeptidase [Chloroflexi bacterium]|nr:M67 family metallopeptidase [Chloroflexota bacterium]